MKQEILTGVQYIRTHVDVTDPKLTALLAMLELREEVKDTCTLQIIAFPQEGMYAYQGGDKLVEEALTMGADLVGASPILNIHVKTALKASRKLSNWQ